jgi:D-alanyl-D-alanine carboxypeptidase (penicillin-binding protein 5/6)
MHQHRAASGYLRQAMKRLPQSGAASPSRRRRATHVWTASVAAAAAALLGALATSSGTAAASARPAFVVGRGAPTLPLISATSFVVADLTTGRILASYNDHERLAPASTLKILTADTLLPQLSKAASVKGSLTAQDVECTCVGIRAGHTYNVGDLFTAMLMMSANDAAISLADANGGISRTVAQMNTTAARLQAYDTHAGSVSGLDAPGQTSSAYDLALLFRDGYNLDSIPGFRHALSLQSALFPAPSGKAARIYTHDRLLAQYPGMLGGKNGYTTAAHASFVGAATRGGHTIVVAVMRDVPDFWPEVTALLNWGFAADGRASSVGALANPRR